MKTCKACQETKAFTEFHKDRQKSDGHALYCKPCFIAKQRQYQSRPPRRADPEGQKRCARCKETKPIEAFGNSTKTHDGKSKRCKTCDSIQIKTWRTNNLERAAELQKDWRTKNPERSADYHLRKRYGVPLGWYEETLAKQEGKCAICSTTDPGGTPRKDDLPRRFHVDHCHDTDVVRGLLCHNCNVGIGNLRHNEVILRRAIDYLRLTEGG